MPSIRFVVILFVVSSVVAVATFWHIHVTGRPPVVLPIDATGTIQRSPPFTIYGRGLYVVRLQFEGRATAPMRVCLHAPQLGPSGCAPTPPPLSWSIYRHGKLVAQNDRGPPSSIDDEVRSEAGGFTREIGAVELPVASGYALEIQPLDRGPTPGLVRPTVSLRLHPWDVKQGLAEVMAFWLAAVIAAATLFSMMVIAGMTFLARRRPVSVRP